MFKIWIRWQQIEQFCNFSPVILVLFEIIEILFPLFFAPSLWLSADAAAVRASCMCKHAYLWVCVCKYAYIYIQFIYWWGHHSKLIQLTKGKGKGKTIPSTDFPPICNETCIEYQRKTCQMIKTEMLVLVWYESSSGSSIDSSSSSISSNSKYKEEGNWQKNTLEKTYFDSADNFHICQMCRKSILLRKGSYNFSFALCLVVWVCMYENQQVCSAKNMPASKNYLKMLDLLSFWLFSQQTWNTSIQFVSNRTFRLTIKMDTRFDISRRYWIW